ncbi:MAG: hypothetical protein ACJ788_20350, partial [Ktedonobacteraceae bacterium]
MKRTLLITSLYTIITLLTIVAGVLVGPSMQSPSPYSIGMLAALVLLIGLLSHSLWRLQLATPERKQATEQHGRAQMVQAKEDVAVLGTDLAHITLLAEAPELAVLPQPPIPTGLIGRHQELNWLEAR